MPARRPEIHRALRFDTGSPWLDLLATVGSAYGPAPIERLPGVPELVTWLGREGLTPAVPPTPVDLAAVRELRADLRAVVLAVLDDRPVSAAEVAALQSWTDAGEPFRVALHDGRPAPEPPTTVRAALAGLARRAVEDLPTARLGACAADHCRMAFVDPGGRRRWCSAERCGVQARVRAHRARS